MKNKNKKFDNVFAKLAAQENAFFNSEFLGPVIQGRPVRVRLSGVVLNLSIVKPVKYEGWGIYKPLTSKTAELVREPTMGEKRKYLDLFPVLRLIICDRKDDKYFGIPAYSGDTRFKIEGIIPINLAKEVQMFETVQSRFDGESCWFDSIDPGANLRSAKILRDSIAQEVEIDKLPESGLSKEERRAYAIAFLRQIENKKDRNEERLKDALERAGAEYRSYIERADTYMVEYVVGGENHRSVVKKDSLEVQSAGICLSGYDKNYDLRSLVGVIIEGQDKRKIVRVDNNPNGYFGYQMRNPGEEPDYDDD